MRTKWLGSVMCLNAILSGAWAGSVMADAAGDAIGQQVAADLRARYYDTRMFCNRTSAPGFTCNGIILRVTTPSTSYKFWAPSPVSVANGGWSFSYERKDAQFRRTVRHEDNGNIVFPPLATPPDKIPVKVYCGFVEDGATFTRMTKQGCGPSDKATSDSRVCHEQGITTADQWIAKHKKDGLNNLNQCAFNLRDDANEKATQSFEALINAIRQDTDSFDQQNELRLAIWDPSQPKTLPIEALFYLPGGLADAQYDQKDYLNSSGECRPIMRMALAQTRSADATIEYVPSDQQCSPTPTAQYIESAVWVERPDPVSGKKEWSLSVTLTHYGKDAKADRTDAVYAELEKKFGKDPQWKDNDGGGMRRQLVCHYVIARAKTPWNLEPRRKDTSEQVAEANGCNPPY